nr:WAT1-related protein At1g25270-like [Ipomoea batatas]
MDRVEKIMERSGEKKQFWNFVHGLKPVMMMITANIFFSGMSILYKIASTKGISLRIIIAYRFIIAAVLSLLIAFYTESISMKGPVFVSAFNPFMLICVAIASIIFLKENPYLGSVIGAVAIIVGLYMVIWGKHKEMKEALSKLAPAESDDEEVPNPDKKDVKVGNNVVAVAPNFISVPGRVAVGEKEVELQGVAKGDLNV